MTSFLQKKGDKYKEIVEDSNREGRRTSTIYTVPLLAQVLGASACVCRAIPLQDRRQLQYIKGAQVLFQL